MATFGTQSSLPTVANWNATGYGPGKDKKMEGGLQTARPNYEGTYDHRTAYDYIMGNVGYITVATDPKYIGQFFNIPEFKVTIDGQTYTRTNVPAYSADVGPAIQGEDVDIPVDIKATDAEMKSVDGTLKMEPITRQEFASRVKGPEDLVRSIIAGEYPTYADMQIGGAQLDAKFGTLPDAWDQPYQSIGVLDQYGPSLPTPAGAVPPATSATIDPTLSTPIREDAGFGLSRPDIVGQDYGLTPNGYYGADRTVGGGYRAHAGNDFGSPVGTEIGSPGAGVVTAVIEAPYNPSTGQTIGRGGVSGYGNVAQVDYGPNPLKPGENIVATFAHMGDLNVKVGQTVQPGDVIGTSAATGVYGRTGERVTTPHVHYELSSLPADQINIGGFTSTKGRSIDPNTLAPFNLPATPVDLAALGARPNTLPAGAATPPAVSNPAAPVPTPPAAAAPAPDPLQGVELAFGDAPAALTEADLSAPQVQPGYAPPRYDPVAAFGGQLAPQAGLTEADLSAPQVQPDYPTGPIAPIFDPSTPPPASFGTPAPSSPAVAPPDDFALPMAGPPAQPAYSPTSSTFNPASLGLPETPYAPAAPSTTINQTPAPGMMAGGGYPMPTARPEAQTLESLPGLESFGRQNMPVDAAAIAAQAKAQTDQQAFGGPAPGLGAMTAAGFAQTAAPLALGQMATLGMAAPLAAATTVPAGIAQAASKLPDSYDWKTQQVMNNPGLIGWAGPDIVAQKLAEMGAGRAITSGQQAVSNFFTDTVPKGVVSGLTQAQATVDELLGPKFGTPPTPPTVAAPPAPVVTAQQPPALPPVETPPAPAPAPTAPLSASELDDLQLTAFGEAPPSTPAPPATPPAEAPVAAPPPTVAGPLSLEEQLKSGNTTGLPPGVDPGPPPATAPTTGGSAPSKAAAAATIAAAAAAGAAAPRAAPAAGFGQAPVPADPRVGQDPAINGMQSPNAPPGYYATEGPTYNAGYGFGVMPTGQWNWATTQLPYTEGMTSQGSWVPAGYEWAGEQAQIAATGSGPFGALADAFGYQY